MRISRGHVERKPRPEIIRRAHREDLAHVGPIEVGVIADSKTHDSVESEIARNLRGVAEESAIFVPSGRSGLRIEIDARVDTHRDLLRTSYAEGQLRAADERVA